MNSLDLYDLVQLKNGLVLSVVALHSGYYDYAYTGEELMSNDKHYFNIEDVQEKLYLE